MSQTQAVCLLSWTIVLLKPDMACMYGSLGPTLFGTITNSSVTIVAKNVVSFPGQPALPLSNERTLFTC